MSSPIPPTDLTRRPPRSMRQRLGGFVLLPRILDKGRAKLAKKNGEYNYDSPTDHHPRRFPGLSLKRLPQDSTNGKAYPKTPQPDPSPHSIRQLFPPSFHCSP